MSESLTAPHPLLEHLQGKRVYFDPLRGNHGDTLLRLAAERLLEHGQVARVPSPEEAEVIVLNGGGAMSAGWFGLDLLARYNREHPDLPLVVWPSSFLVETDSFAASFVGRRAPVWLWSREPYSLKLLETVRFPCPVHLQLGHDLAFALADHRRIAPLKDLPSRNTVLIVERRDWEGATPRPPDLRGLPRPVRALVRRVRGGRPSPFARAALKLVQSRHPRARTLTPVVVDISLKKVCDFDHFLAACAGADVIVTTRLHVAILAHLLDKPAYLVDGAYHKFRGVYEHSLQGGSVRLVRWSPSLRVLEDAHP